MKTLKYLLLINLILIPFTIWSQTTEQLKVDLEIRPRFEFRNGLKTPIEESKTAAALIEQRNRLYIDYKNDVIQTHFVLQDVRIWGNHNQIYKSDPALTNIYEAWAAYSFNKSSLIKFGRQELNYDNARFLGNLDWAQQGRSHDAFVYQSTWKDKGLKLHIGFTWNEMVGFEPSYLTNDFYSRANNKTMQFIWLNKTYEKASVSFLFHNNGVESAADSVVYFMPTVGLVGSYSFNKDVKYNGEFYYQFGSDGARRDVSAFFINSEFEFKQYKNTYKIGVDFASGTDPYETSSNNSWNPLYGTNHKFYGYMDYFYGGNAFKMPGANYDAGIVNIYEKISLPVSSGMLNIDLHQFISPTYIYNSASEKMGSYLGTEIDLTYVIKPTKSVNMVFGYSQMIQSESLEILKGSVNPSSNNSWAWIMIQIKPTIFSK